MYSQAALNAYPELLKYAREAVSAELEKDAGLGDTLYKTFTSRGRALARNAVARGAQKGTSAAARSAEAASLQAGRKVDPKRIAMLLDNQRLSGADVMGKLRSSTVGTGKNIRSGQGAELYKNLDVVGQDSVKKQMGLRNAIRATPAAPAAETAAAAKPGMGLGTKALIAGGIGASGLGAYQFGKHQQAKQDKTQRNIAFGAGAAAGLAAPYVLRSASNTLGNLSLNPFGGGM